MPAIVIVVAPRALASSVLCKGITYPVSRPIAAAPPTAYLLAVIVSPVGTEIVPVATLPKVVLPDV